MEKNEQKEKRLNKTLNKLEISRVLDVQKLMERSFTDLRELSERYWMAYQAQKESNEILSAEVIYKKYNIIKEAITAKKGIEEEVWDSLT